MFCLGFQQAIGARVSGFFQENIAGLLQEDYQAYVIDFAVTDDDIFVIEINPFVSNVMCGKGKEGCFERKRTRKKREIARREEDGSSGWERKDELLT